MAKTSMCVTMSAALASLALVAVESGLMGSSFAASAPRVVEPGACLAEMERSIVHLFERASLSVVQIAAFSGADDAATFVSKIGSGFVWDATGNIVTNEHVVRGASMIVVWLASGERAEADAVGAAPNHDLAVIRLKETRVLPPPIPIGNSRDLKVGQFAYAIGSPFGLDQSLTTGVISALKRQLPTDNGGAITQVIQTDAAIYPGNSGGTSARFRGPSDRRQYDLLRADGIARGAGLRDSCRAGEAYRAGAHQQRTCLDARHRHCRGRRNDRGPAADRRRHHSPHRVRLPRRTRRPGSEQLVERTTWRHHRSRQWAACSKRLRPETIKSTSSASADK